MIPSTLATPTGCPFVVADPCQHNRIRTPPRSPVHLMGKEIWAGLETRSWSLEHEHLMIWSTFLIWAVQNRLWTMINRKLTKQSYKNRALLMRESERGTMMNDGTPSIDWNPFPIEQNKFNWCKGFGSGGAASAAQAANNTFFDHSASAGGRRRCIQQSEIRLQVDLQPGSRVFSRKGIWVLLVNCGPGNFINLSYICHKTVIKLSFAQNCHKYVIKQSHNCHKSVISINLSQNFHRWFINLS